MRKSIQLCMLLLTLGFGSALFGQSGNPAARVPFPGLQMTNPGLTLSAAPGTTGGNLTAMPSTCGPDTLLYPLAKATGLNALGISDSLACGQWYPAPQAITIHGMSFYAWVDSITNQTVTLVCRVYNAGADSLPTGAPLATSTIVIDSNFYGGQLGLLEKSVAFSAPVTVNGPYVVTVQNNSAINVGFVTNDYTAGDGGQEWLGHIYLPAPNSAWFHGYQLTLGPSTFFDADNLIYPHVTYTLTAAFQPNPSSGCVGIPSVWQNQSSPVMESPFYNSLVFANGLSDSSYTWTFGSGIPAENQIDGDHTYTVGGAYTVTLRDTLYSWRGANCVDAATGSINIGTGVAVQAGFTSITSQLNAVFTDASSGSPLAWYWTFGDGATSTVPNPNHAYTAAGTYNVCLVVANNCGADTLCQIVTVTSGCPTPVTAFTFSANNLNLSFTNQTTGGTTYLWNFGDGGTSTQTNPTHTYANVGTFNVCLIATNACGSDTFCQAVNVTCNAPGVAFSNTANALVLSFTDLSTGNPTGWQWDFGDGTPVSIQQNPTHTYALPGVYQVCLTAINACGSNTTCLSIGVSCPPPSTSFSFLTVGPTVNFTNTTGGGFSAQAWSFGDGSTSTFANPSHTYTAVGTYNVCLITSGTCGQDTFCQQVLITCVPPVSNFSSVVSNDSVLSLTNQASVNTQSWIWTFGDGSSSTAANPTHIYQAPGTYNVCLEVINSCGRDTLCETVNITCTNPTSGYTVQMTNSVAQFSDVSLGAQSYFWDFGDGSTSTLASPSHAYTASGIFTACLTVTNFCGSNTSCQNLVVSCNIPSASFAYVNGVSTVDFQDQSTNFPTEWFWDFGDGSTDTVQNPNHLFIQPGQFFVCLQAINACGSNSTCQFVTVTAVGAEEQMALDHSLSVSPNPGTGLYTVHGSISKPADLQFRVVNALGQVVYVHQNGRVSGEFNHEIDLTAFSGGAYHLEVKAGAAVSTRILVKH